MLKSIAKIGAIFFLAMLPLFSAGTAAPNARQSDASPEIYSRKIGNRAEIRGDIAQTSPRSLRLTNVTVNIDGAKAFEIASLAILDANIAAIGQGAQTIGSLELRGLKSSDMETDLIIARDLLCEWGAILGTYGEAGGAANIARDLETWLAKSPPDMRIGKIHAENVKNVMGNTACFYKTYDGRDITPTTLGPQRMSGLSLFENNVLALSVGEVTVDHLAIPHMRELARLINGAKGYDSRYIGALEGFTIKNLAITSIDSPREQISVASLTASGAFSQARGDFDVGLLNLIIPANQLKITGFSAPPRLDISLDTRGTVQLFPTGLRLVDKLNLDASGLIALQSDSVLNFNIKLDPTLEKLKAKITDKGIVSRLSPALKLLIAGMTETYLPGLGARMANFLASTNGVFVLNTEEGEPGAN